MNQELVTKIKQTVAAARRAGYMHPPSFSGDILLTTHRMTMIFLPLQSAMLGPPSTYPQLFNMTSRKILRSRKSQEVKIFFSCLLKSKIL